jgi:flagellar motor switch protein FliG
MEMDVSEKFSRFLDGLDIQFVKNNIYQVDKTKIAKSLKTIDPRIYKNLLKAISEQYAEEIEDMMKNFGPIELSEIENTQKELMNMVG